jgi:hypothetical protein
MVICYLPLILYNNITQETFILPYKYLNLNKLIKLPKYLFRIFLKSEINMNSSQFKEIIVFEDFKVENGVFGLERDIYLSIVKFLDSSTVRKVSKYFIL